MRSIMRNATPAVLVLALFCASLFFSKPAAEEGQVAPQTQTSSSMSAETQAGLREAGLSFRSGDEIAETWIADGKQIDVLLDEAGTLLTVRVMVSPQEALWCGISRTSSPTQVLAAAEAVASEAYLPEIDGDFGPHLQNCVLYLHAPQA